MQVLGIVVSVKSCSKAQKHVKALLAGQEESETEQCSTGTDVNTHDYLASTARLRISQFYSVRAIRCNE